MASDIATRRLQRELRSMQKKPMTNPIIVAAPRESNILEWHYVVEGPKDTAFEGGYFWGKLIFPKEYPLKPPGVLMFTPSGRFKPNRRLCLSMSDFHPEQWNPMWSVSTILTGLVSFMVEKAPTLGSLETSDAQKRILAAQSLDFNCKDQTFRSLFPDYVELNEERRRNRPTEAAGAPNDVAKVTEEGGGVGMAAALADGHEGLQGLFALGAGLVAFVSIILAMRFI